MGLQGASLSPPHGKTGAASRASWELLRCLGHVWGAAQQAAPTALGRWGDTEKTALKRHKALPERGTQTSPATARRWKGSHKTMETEMNVMRGLYPNREGLKEQGVRISQRTFPTFVSACCWDAVCCGPIQLFTVTLPVVRGHTFLWGRQQSPTPAPWASSHRLCQSEGADLPAAPSHRKAPNAHPVPEHSALLCSRFATALLCQDLVAAKFCEARV